MENKHTPAPWFCKQEKPFAGVDVYAEGEYICTTSGNAKANALLIASAPELLEKCIKIVKWLNMLANAADARCINNRFETLVEANKADAKNYRTTAQDIQKVIDKATGEKGQQL
jgi:hypothetical protein